MKITIKNLQKRIRLTTQAKQEIKKAVRESCVLYGGRRARAASVTVCLVDDPRIRELNLYYLAHNAATDVIAFDLSSPERICADIAVSADTACANARAFKTSPVAELLLYCAHGMLHILGYDDRTERQRTLMNRKACAAVERALGKRIYGNPEDSRLRLKAG